MDRKIVLTELRKALRTNDPKLNERIIQELEDIWTTIKRLESEFDQRLKKLEDHT